RELLLDEELGLGLVLKFFEELGDFQLHLLVADFLFQSWFFRLQLLVGVCGDATDALQDDRAFRRSNQAADLAGLEAECLVLQLIVAGRVSADRGDTAAGRRQGRAGLLFGDAVEVFVALTDVGVHLKSVFLLPGREKNDATLNLFAVIGLERLLVIVL